MAAGAQSFTIQLPYRARELVTKVQVAPSFSPDARSSAHRSHEWDAIWDTGATGSVITEEIIRECGLMPVSFTRVFHAGGVSTSPVFIVDIQLPNQMGFAGIRVTRAELSGPQVLIGMDIIAQGDFSITNVGGKTMFSFRVPSRESIDDEIP